MGTMILWEEVTQLHLSLGLCYLTGRPLPSSQVQSQPETRGRENRRSRRLTGSSQKEASAEQTEILIQRPDWPPQAGLRDRQGQGRLQLASPESHQRPLKVHHGSYSNSPSS